MQANDGQEFTARALARLGALTPPPGLERRLLDAYAARMRRGGIAARLAELVWPGMPAWAPGAAFALALLLGIGAGMALPDPAMAGGGGFSLARPPSFSLESLLAEESR
jgi:hypothetical protein